ncbi:hypothetical protein BDP55DRAFT_676033 [Colletotrichum godetiae]|uniref:Uncharacterized protein n=1 Tax=Colletotrichum godetiae TaxID=1209918 RepID=A0AAJ0ACP1_9PEZI|nr:uncharacterized protein BDP55DRAFT_676033 [Colletotrichum godetiae]KAK1671382.1 hypothetical protein BDP55DRAFT_676033 [Colletotrichum godetiae]
MPFPSSWPSASLLGSLSVSKEGEKFAAHWRNVLTTVTLLRQNIQSFAPMGGSWVAGPTC